MQINFSVIIAAYNSEKWIEECLNSLIFQDIGFEENIEVIIVDDNSTDNTKSVCKKFIDKFPDNFKYIRNDENLGPAISRNIGLDNANGKYVNFLDSDDYFSKTTFKNVLNFFDTHDETDIVSIPIFFFEDKQGPHYLNKKFDESKTVNLIENPQFYQLSGPSSFVKKSAANNIEFPNIVTSEDVVFVNEILINNPNLGLCCEGRYNYRKRQDKSSIIDNSQTDKSYYIPRVEKYFNYLFDKSEEKYGQIPKFIQNVIMYDISWMFKVNNIPEILEGDELSEFKKSLEETIKKIDDEIILNYEFFDKYDKINAFLLKYGTYSHPIFSKFQADTIFVDNYDIIEDKLRVLFNIDDFNTVDIEAYVNNEKIALKELKFPQRDKRYLDYIYCENFSFEFEIDLSKNQEYTLEFKNKNQMLNIDFSRPCNFSKIVGYAKTKDYLSILQDNRIHITHKTTMKWIKQEIKALIHMLKEKKQGYKVGIPFRIMYMVGYPFLKNKHIWFFMDRPEVADDNGMHLFRYAVDKDKNIKKYFIIKKESPDYGEMEKIGKVLGFKSIKHRFLGLFVENIVTSIPDNEIIYPFWGSYPHLAGLHKSNNVFLQHGIIKDDISSWLNKYKMNLSFFLTSAPLEYESIFKHPYNYDENVVQLLGLPRYDTLENNENKKQVIIMPSWRRKFTRKSANYITKSEFFKRFNSLINNEKLIEACRQHDYEIIFKPHPKVYEFIDLFDENEYVTIADSKIKYQTLFNNGSLLITDYSSVAFDFSYLHKPVLYYHYSDDYHFDLNDSYFDYETMGFGEVIKDEKELVDLIIDYIENDCQIKDEYSKRIDEFFLYNDKENCKRVYDAIKKLPLKD